MMMMMCYVLFQLAQFVWTTLPSNWLARLYPMMHFVCMRVHQPLSKAVHMNCFDIFIIVLVTVIF